MRIVSRMIGCGSYLPAQIISNHDLAQKIETSDEWIVQRTGITQRHMAAQGENTSDLAIAAGRQALTQAGISGEQLDAVIVATTTPDETFPATATKVQAALGMTGGFAFDVQAVCSGFIYALAVADNFIRAGQAKNILVIGAETFTRLLDWQDRTSCVLFGDGAGAVVLRADQNNATLSDYGILSTHLHSDGYHREILVSTGGVSSTQSTGVLAMEGREVFRHAVTRLSEVVDEVLGYHHMTPDQIDWLVPHQANIRIIEATAKKLSMPMDKVITTVAKHANTSAASIPLALAQGVVDGRIQQGNMVLMEGMGAGLTWGAALARIG